MIEVGVVPRASMGEVGPWGPGSQGIQDVPSTGRGPWDGTVAVGGAGWGGVPEDEGWGPSW